MTNISADTFRQDHGSSDQIGLVTIVNPCRDRESKSSIDLILLASISGFPRIDQPHAAALKVIGIARGQCRLIGSRNSGNLRICKRNGSTAAASVGRNLGVLVRCALVEGQDTSPEVLTKRAFRLTLELVAPPALWKDRDSVQNLSHCDGRSEEITCH
jgi:hypothetical protein